MPHAEQTKAKAKKMTTAPITNGEKPSSLFLSHLHTYPVVSDAVKTYKQNPYGAKSLDIATIAYDKLAVPFLPYLRTPYSIIHPYVTKADSLADNGLHKVDENFPVVKKDTSKLKDGAISYALWPLRVVGQSRDYLFNTYADEHKKVGGEGLVRTAKAFISTELRIAQETVAYAASYFSESKKEVKQKIDEKKQS